MIRSLRLCALGALLAGATLSASLHAAPPAAAPAAASSGLTVKPLLRGPLSGDESREAVLVAAEFAPGAATGRHSHAGDEYATVLEGELELHRDGQPVQRVKAGEAYHSPRGVIHETRNPGSVKARTVATFIVDKGQPLLIPAPAAP